MADRITTVHMFKQKGDMPEFDSEEFHPIYVPRQSGGRCSASVNFLKIRDNPDDENDENDELH